MADRLAAQLATGSTIHRKNSAAEGVVSDLGFGQITAEAFVVLVGSVD